MIHCTHLINSLLFVICCEGRHSYRLSIEHESIIIIASDPSGLLYGLYALVQLLQLHCEVNMDGSTTVVYVPPIILHDFPDVPNRAILWSYRKNCCMNLATMKSHIDLFSILRINRLLLVIDPVVNTAATTSAQGAIDSNYHTLTSYCSSALMDIIPTFICTSCEFNVSKETILQFEQNMICIHILLDINEVEANIKSKSNPKSDNYSNEMKCQARCKEFCHELFSSIQSYGITTVLLNANSWTRRVASPYVSVPITTEHLVVS